MSSDPPEPDRTVFAPLGSVPPAGAAPVAPPPAFPAPPESTPGNALVGVQLNDLFEAVRFIAEGGMGQVYEGRNIASGERVAIKVILSQYAADEQFMALFRREASALERIGHDALVKYRALAFDRARGINYLVIEYVDGPSLAAVLAGEPADPALAMRMLRRLALGLGAAHDAGVIHRDLSPDNILLPGGNIERAKIIDFGIAKDTSLGAKSVVGEAFAGKFGYAAPEVFGKYGRRIGPWSDIYSLALVVAAFARGTPVDMGVTIVDALDARAAVPDLSDIAPELRAILEKMLAPDPADRFQTMDEVAEAAGMRGTQFGTLPGLAASPLGAAAPATPTEPPAPAFVRAGAAASPTPAADAAPRRRTPMIAAAAAAALAVAGVGGWMLLGDDDAPAPADGAAPQAVPPAQPDTPAIPSWSAARPAVIAALTAVPCSDVRIAGPSDAGTVRLAGWRSAASPLPAAAGGWRLDASAVEAVDAPAAETCRLFDAVRVAAADDPDRPFALPAVQRVSLATAPRSDSGYAIVDLQVAERPPGRVLIANIDDDAASDVGRVVSGDVDSAKLELGALPFSAKPARYLAVLVASSTELPVVTARGDQATLRQACTKQDCTLASGWIEIR